LGVFCKALLIIAFYFRYLTYNFESGLRKLWRLKYRHLGKEQQLTIGIFPDVGQSY
jgi:hypothetical protein